ncbi:hypothetical protein FA15DRAFT_669215, partial [Coprinopsis marcescibilis]
EVWNTHHRFDNSQLGCRSGSRPTGANDQRKLKPSLCEQRQPTLSGPCRLPLNQVTTRIATSSPCFRMLIVNYPPGNPIYDITHLENSDAPLLHALSALRAAR